jgi:hypothetical protein
LFRQCEARGWRTVALYGAGDLAEIAILSAGAATTEVLCVVDQEGREGVALASWSSSAGPRRNRGAVLLPFGR